MKVFNKLKQASYTLLKAVLVLSLVFSRTSLPAAQYVKNTDNDENAICGVWYTNKNNSKVEIFNKNGSYYGKIIWLKDPGKSMYTNKLVILNMAYNQNRHIWESGTLYYPVKDAEYKGYIEMPHRDTLLIRAYLGSPLIGKTITWVRAK